MTGTDGVAGSDGLTDLFGLLAYAELVAFFNLSGDAALASTLVTSVAGVITFVILSLHAPGAVSPEWDDGIALCIGGLAGGYTGARLQSRMPDVLIRRLVGVLVIGIGAYFLSSGLG